MIWMNNHFVNLGSISKTILTGKNFFNTSSNGNTTPGRLDIPADVRILGDFEVQGTSNAVPLGTVMILTQPGLSSTTTTIKRFTIHRRSKKISRKEW